MSSSKPAGQTVTTTSNAPWSGQQPFLTEGFERAETDVLNKPSEYYPNSTVVPFSNQTEQALGLQEQRAVAGSPVEQAAQNQVQQTAQGDFLGQNPYLTQAINQATQPIADRFNDTVIPGIQSGFSGKNRYGSGMQAYQQRMAGEQAMKQMGDVAGAMSYKNYGDERARQQQASSLAPQMGQIDYQNISNLANVGQVRENQAGAELQEDINRFQHGQQAPKDALAQYMALVGGGSYGGDSTSSAPIYRNQAADALGMAGTAAGIAGSLFGKGGIWP